MKTVLLTLCALLLIVCVKGQTISFVNNKEVPLKKDENSINLPKSDAAHPISTLFFKVNSIGKTQKVTITFDDKKEGTAKLTEDYTYENNSINNPVKIDNTTSPPIFAVDIKPKTDRKTNAVLYIKIASDNPKLDNTYKIIINFNTTTITPKISQSLVAPDTSKWYLRIVTGGNFDFFNGPTIKDFAGDISLFVPNLFKIGQLPIGVELGMNNYHYFDTDSSHTVTDGSAYFLRNADYYTPTDSSKIVRTSQNVNRKYDYNVWGIHANVLIPAVSNDFAQIYSELHFEELATTETYTPTLANSTNDTITYTQYKNLYNNGTLNKVNGAIPIPQAHQPVFYPYKQHTYYDIYLGEGFFGNINIKNVAKFCYSITAGPAFIELAQPNFDPNPVQRDIIGRSGNSHETKLYVLNKFQLITTIAPVDIAMGGEYRTVAGNMHYFTTYIGATITMDKLKR